MQQPHVAVEAADAVAAAALGPAVEVVDADGVAQRIGQGARPPSCRSLAVTRQRGIHVCTGVDEYVYRWVKD